MSHLWIFRERLSSMSLPIPIDLSTCPFITVPRFFNSRRTPPLLNPSLSYFRNILSERYMVWVVHGVCSFWNLYRLTVTVHHSSIFTFFPLALVFFYSTVIKSSFVSLSLSLSFCLSLHRHPYLCIPLHSLFIRHNKQQSSDVYTKKEIPPSNPSPVLFPLDTTYFHIVCESLQSPSSLPLCL